MRVLSTLVASLGLLSTAMAIDVMKSVIVSYPAGTSDDVLARAKQDIRNAGGIITHEYTLIKAFAAKAPAAAFDTVSAWSTSEGVSATFEDVQTISIPKEGPQ